MSQRSLALDLIDRESGLSGLILRPLSAALLEPTVPEVEGWVRREKLLQISGRSRKPQLALAQEKGIMDFPCPAGGCLLTDKSFALKLRDYFEHTDSPRTGDMALLKTGRHFRMPDGSKVVVARDAFEGEKLQTYAKENQRLFTPLNFSGPVVLLDGENISGALEALCRYTKKSCDGEMIVVERFKGLEKQIVLEC